MRIDGPVVIEEPASATVVEPGQHVLVDEWGNLVVEWNNDSSQEESVL
uniref:Uncharacterized protein n=1 Tax=Nocardia farcinica TaxID=37329 RepID=A0A449G650_NOCFR